MDDKLIKYEKHRESFKPYGLGFSENIDWLQLTWEERIVKDAGPYRDVGYAWQYLLDWSLLNYPRIYHQLARGHDKTERETWWMLLWGLTAPGGQGFCCGVDRENAQLYKTAAKWIVDNHSLFSDWKVHNYDLHHKKNGCHIRILASDEQSNYGLTPDLLLITDFHGWSNHGFWDALWTAMGKRPNSRMWIESNALALGSEQVHWIRPVREFAKQEHERGRLNRLTPGPLQENKRWFYYAPKGFYAPWQKVQLREWAGTMLPSAFKRLILNEDTSEGDAYVTEEQVMACEVLKGPSNLTGNKPQTDANILVTTDLGLSTDAAVVAVVSEYTRNNTQFIELNHMIAFTGSRDEPVKIEAVVNCADSFAAAYGAKKYCDPWEMRGVMQKDPSWNEYTFSANNVKNLTQRMWRTIVSKRLRIWPNVAPAMQAKKAAKPAEWNLKRELTEAVLKDTSYGQRVDHKSQGFTDRLMALGMAIDLLYQEPMPGEKKPEVSRILGADSKLNEYISKMLLPVGNSSLTIV